jgi:hypothetical protein
MLTAEDREEIKQLVGAIIAESGASASRQHRDAANMRLLSVAVALERRCDHWMIRHPAQF